MDILNDILKVKPSGIKLETGKILISSPFMEDSLFGRSIILITDISDDNGAIGLILNKPTEILLEDVTEDFPIKDMPLYAGGPVQGNTLFILHSYGDLIEDSVHIIDDIYWGGNKQQVEELLKLGTISPDNIKFFLGYSGWSENQLQDELKTESWIIANKSDSINILKSITSADLWKEYVSSFGAKYKLWIKMPETPIDN